MRKVIYTLKKVMFFGSLLIVSAFANLAIKMMPFKKLMAVLTNVDQEVEHEFVGKQRQRLGYVDRYLMTIGQKVPWRVKCFEQAVTALVVCRLLKVNVNVVFGIKKSDGNDLAAHAWTTINGLGLTGYRNAHEYTEVYRRGLKMN